MQPLAGVIETLYLEFFPKQLYPVRAGTHGNTAFGLAFAWDYAVAAGHSALRELVRQRGLTYYGGDRACPAAYEPGGNDFFSPCLLEADLMRRLLPAPDFAAWLDGFLPALSAGGLAALLRPAQVADRADGQLVHLDGLNLSRAWCCWNVAGALGAADTRSVGLQLAQLREAAARHAEAGLARVLSGDYMGEHWLATFAVYALECAAGRA
jgi:hypothetical protein